MANLRNETKSRILSFGYKESDVIAVIASNEACTYEEFISISDFQYDAGYGGVEIRSDLIVLFKDSNYLRREEYDGSEGWELIAPVGVPHNPKPLTELKDK